jgi:hypothetical protein
VQDATDRKKSTANRFALGVEEPARSRLSLGDNFPDTKGERPRRPDPHGKLRRNLG